MESIKKHKSQRPFTIIGNDCLRDTELSWKAKGLIAYVFMLPEDWQLNMQDLRKRSKDGRDSLLSGIKELINHGYCRRTAKRNGAGQMAGIEYEIADYKAFQPEQENTVADEQEKPEPENPKKGKPQLQNTNRIQNTKSIKNTPANDAGELFPDTNPNKKTLFRNSIYATFETFEKQFREPEFANVDLAYYFHSVADWSDSANKQRTARGWLATARNFMRGDADKKRLRLKQTPQQNSQEAKEAMDYLKGFE